MKRIIKTMLSLVFAVFILVLSYYLMNRFSYAKTLPFFEKSSITNTNVTIGIIGDSWVANNNLDSFLQEKLMAKGVNNKIVSSGNSSARSKLIYQNIFKDSTQQFSSQFVIKANPDYCVVVAGVNDAAGQIGANFYAHHIKLIIKTLLHFNIKPVIVELPEFGIVEYTNNTTIINKIRYKIPSFINNKGEIDNIKTYRQSLNNHLAESNLLDKIVFVKFDNICSDYNDCKELYKKDGLHLNRSGNEVLSHHIANAIYENVTKTH